MRPLMTTAVGSYPKPKYILEARSKVARGQMSRQELEVLEKQATKEWIQFQEEIGLDIMVDGEQYRGDMVTYFAENLQGFAISGLVRSYGNRYYRKPIAIGPIRRKGSITLGMFLYTQSLTQRPVKGMLTGPYTICDWSFNDYFKSREEFVMEIAQVVHQEALDLERAGAQYIQIDEPAVSTRPDEIDLAIKAMGVATQGLKATTITHICYGDFNTAYPRLLDMPVDILDLEMANSNYDMLELFKRHPFTKILTVGVVDVHNHAIESVAQVKEGIYHTLEVVPPERLLVDADCGLKTRTVEEAKAKLRVMQQAVKEVKRELNLEGD
ncbi:MAG: methionine synthase [Dehalococcoidia bacterium]